MAIIARKIKFIFLKNFVFLSYGSENILTACGVAMTYGVPDPGHHWFSQRPHSLS